MSRHRRVALVTGASRRAGIGFAVARRLAEAGLDVVLHGLPDYDVAQGRAPESGPDLVAERRALGVGASAFEADFRDAEAPQRLAAHAVSEHGRLGQPDDAARLIAWLVSEQADWVTGQLISSTGGFRRS